MLSVGLVVLIICYFQPPAIMWMTYFAGTVFAASWGPTCIMSIWSKKIAAIAAFCGIIVGFATNTIVKFGDVYDLWNLPVWADPFVIGLVSSILVIMIVSANTKVTDAQRKYQESLFQVPKEDYSNFKEIKRTMLYPKIAIGVGIGVSLVLILIYVIPYHRAFLG